ncbi:MAG: hypothetical protein M3N43_07820 [Actinomycetota bacterium]|nr:hypothetical protein [Actinomycetota bacterium]
MTEPCYAGARCRDYDRARKTPAIAEVGPLCAACLGGAARSVRALTYDYVDLAQLVPRPTGQRGDGQPGRSGEPPVPINVNVDALQKAIWWVTTTWAEELVAEHRLANPPEQVRDGHAVQWAVGVLAPRVELLARLDGIELVDYPLADEAASMRVGTATITVVTGAQAVLDLDHLHQRARSVLGLTRRVTKLPGECSGCLRADLRQDEPRYQGEPLTIYCGSCGRTWTRDEYERYALLAITWGAT